MTFDLTTDLTDAEKRILTKVASRTNETATQILRRISIRDLIRNESTQATSQMVERNTIPEAIVAAIEAMP